MRVTRLWLWMVAAALAVCLVGAPASAARTKLTFWHTYNAQSAEEREMLEKVIPAFEAANPDIEVEAQGFPYQEFHQKLVTSVAGGVVPDVVRMDIIWVPEFARMGALLELDGLAGFAETKEGIFKGCLSTCFWEGKYYGLPLDTNTQIIVYNKDLVAKAGLGAPPKTWKEFADYARKLTKKDSKGRVTQWGYCVPGPYAWYWLPWVWSNGGAVNDDKITRSTGYFNSAATAEALQWLFDLAREGVVAPRISGEGQGSIEGLATGLYAVSQDGPWAIAEIEAQYPDVKVGTALFPEGKAGSVSIVGGEDAVIFKASKNKDAAWKFVRHLLSMPSQMTMATTGQIPVYAKALEDPYMKGHPYYGKYLIQLQTAKARTPHPAWSRIEDIIQTAFRTALSGQAALKAALDQAAAQVDQLLAR